MKNKVIGLIGLNEVLNIGDPILYNSAEYLINENLNKEDKIINISILGSYPSIINSLLTKVITVILKLIAVIGLGNSELSYSLQKKRMQIKSGKYFDDNLKELDALIFAGGGMIKYVYEEFAIIIPIIIEYIEKRYPHITVYFNAVGVEGFDENDIRCQKLKVALNSDAVISVATRDDIDTLSNKYIVNPTVKAIHVADSAFWVDEVYKNYYDKENRVQGLVGLGVARSNMFIDNGIDFGKEDIINMWVEICKELDRREMNWEFYTNGAEPDNDLLRELIANEYFEDRIIPFSIPADDKEFISLTNRFSKVIVTRMHASIVAFTLGIPTIGFVWNVKVRHLSRMINHEERYFDVEDINPKRIVETLISSEFTVDDQNFINDFRQTTYNGLNNFIKGVKATLK